MRRLYRGCYIRKCLKKIESKTQYHNLREILYDIGCGHFFDVKRFTRFMKKENLETADFEFQNNFERIRFPHFLLFDHRARPKHFDNHMAKILCEFRPVWRQELSL